MVLTYSNQSRYLSCIKIAGEVILPPLITEERRKELHDDKTKAIEIEKRIKRKRSSIDSGVMTGSYIDSFRNVELEQTENIPYPELSTSGFANENHQLDVKSPPLELENISTDQFLKCALEDAEFKQYFYSTAEKMFNDNSILNINSNMPNNNFFTCEKNHLNEDLFNENEGTNNPKLSSHISDFPLNNDWELSSTLTLFSSVVDDNSTLKSVTSEILSTEHTGEEISPLHQLARRKSYTLESPSPVLLEHMAKENINNINEREKWKSLTEKKDSEKGLGFKVFLSVKKPRKTWSKHNAERSSSSKSEYFYNCKGNKFCSSSRYSDIKRSKTFVKTNPKGKESNYSLPCSSRTSPIQMSLLAKSTDCIQSALDNSNKFKENDCNGDCSIVSEPIKEINISQQVNVELVTNPVNEKVVDQNDVSPQFVMPNLSNISLLNNISNGSHSSFDIANIIPSQYDLSGSTSKSSTITQSMCSQPKPAQSYMKCTQIRKDQCSEIDDNSSVCSSLSLSKYMPQDDNVSRPSTAEDLSILLSELQLQHEREIVELLEKQQKQKLLLSKLHSNDSSLISSRSSVNMNICDLPSYENNCPNTLCLEEKKTPCSRELFPAQTTNIFQPNKNKTQDKNYSEKEKNAALKLTACVRGYLTRRLLKTEKVQQLIDLIKESLNCAFSLQSETRLKKTDLELHERLALQLSAALYELQSIVSAPVAKRMAIIGTDREKLRKPVSRPSSAISSATRKSIVRRQQSLNSGENKLHESRPRTKSLCLSGNSGLSRSTSNKKNDSSSATSTNNNRKSRK